MKKRLIATASATAIGMAMAVIGSKAALAQVAGATTGGASSVVAAGDTAPDEVVVTARKRAENLQTVADPISVVTANAIEMADLRTLEDAVRLTPNLVVLDGLYPGYKTVSFRGFTTLGRDGEFPFATIVDGVVQPGQMFFQQDLVNVQQIEVLRGPQGTLYGGGAIAGAINVVTRQPTDVFQGGVEAQYLSGDEGRLTATLTGPIIKDSLFFQVGVTADTFRGLIPNLANDHDADFSQGQTTREALIWQAAPNLKFALTASTTDSRVGGLWLSKVSDADFATSSPDPDENQDGVVHTMLRAFSFKADYTVPQFATLTSITAYSRGRDYTTADGDFSPAPIYTQEEHFIDKAWSEELRLASNTPGALKWSVGLFDQDEVRNEATDYGDVGNPPDFFSQTKDYRDYVTTALFGQISYELTDRLTLTGGIRFDWEEQTYTDELAGDTHHQSFREPQGKATLSYEFTQDIFGYISYSRGYRKGGFNPRSVEALLTYAPETADNYEAGVKSSFFDHKLTINGAVFYTDFADQQFETSVVIPGQGIYIAIANIEQTRVMGLEGEFTYRPFRALSIQGSIGYTDDQIIKFLPQDISEYHGNRIPQIYGFTAEIGADYQINLSHGYDMIFHADLSHRGNVYWDVQNSLETPPKNFVNAKASLEKDNWTLSLLVRNLGDERTPEAVGAHAYGTESLSSYNEPRQYGVELGVKF